MKNKVDELLCKTFIKLRSDYGFKEVFGTPKNSGILKRFLNALFEGEMVVTDVIFQDKEVLPPDKSGKTIIYDVYCTTSTGYHFVVEMQQKQSDLFGKRMVFYLSSCIFRQGESGRSYKFDPVYLIVITDFDMKPLEQRLVNEVLLMERKTHVMYTDDLRIYFLSLSQVSNEWDKCESKLERLLYLIKNMENLNKESKPYTEGGYEDIFNASEISSMAKEDLVAYRSSIMIEEERQSEMEFVREEAREEGREKGIEEGIEKVAREMKKSGMSVRDISKFTGLSETQIKKL